MRFALSADAGRWLHCCGSAVLLATMWACNADSPVSPSAPSAGPTPTTHPSAPPAVPGSSKLTLSRPDVVFNAMAGATAIDTAAISVEATAGSAVTDLRAITTYTAGQPDGWLTADLDHATLPAKLTLRARTTPLAAGEYTAIVTLRAPGAPAESLTVTTRVVTGASIGLNAAKICFTTSFDDATPRRDDVRVTSVDGSVLDGLTATIVYDAGQPTGWLETSFDVTSAPARLWLRGTPGTLPVGTYNATVQVSSAKAGNSPVPIRVTLTINAAGPPPPSQRSMANIRMRWETATNGGFGTVEGNTDGGTRSFFCQEGIGECIVVLESGTGEILVGAGGRNGGTFSHWEGACDMIPGSSACFVHFDTPGTTREVTAVFRTGGSGFAIGLPGSGTGTVTPSLGNLTCAFNNNLNFTFCDGGIDEGVGTFTMTATPGAGSVFAGWQLTATGAYAEQDVIGSCHGTAPTCTFTFSRGTSGLSGFATFMAASPTGDRLTVLPATLGVILPANQGIAISENYIFGPDGQTRNGMPPASGTVTGPGIDCRIVNGVVSGDCEERVPAGSTVQLMRHPAQGTYCTASPDTEQPGACAITVTSTPGDIVVPAEFFVKLNSVRMHMTGSGSGSASGEGIHCYLVDGKESESSAPLPPGEPGRCYLGRFGIGNMVYRSEQAYGPGTFVRWTGDCDANSGYPADYCVVTFNGSGKEANITATYTR